MRFHIASRFFPYLGGKHFLVRRLLPLIPQHRVYVEIFGGAAALLFAKERSPVEVYNDLDSDLVNLFEVVRDRKEEFMKRLEWLPYSRELYERYLRDLDERRIVDAVERAVAFCYCMKAAFAGKWRGGWAFARKGGNRAKVWSRLHIDIESIAERVKDLHIDHLDFRRCIKNWDSPDTFFFLDPPYIGTMQPRVTMTETDHRDLAEILRTIQGKWLLTYNNHPLVHELYDNRGFVIQKMRCQMASRKWGQGPRRGALTNLVIRNYRLESSKVGK